MAKMKKVKEYVSVGLITLLTLIVALLVVRKYFPRYFPQAPGMATDLQMVKVSKTLPPFFTGIFRDEKTSEFILSDPTLGIRARPFYGRLKLGHMGPHDVLGFRNLIVPAFADVVVFGDSQTYGLNTVLELNWPSQLAGQLARDCTVYNMAVGGWGPAQYLAMARHALSFRPAIFLVAFYSGNDPLDAFRYAYHFAEFKELRLFPEMSAKDLRAVAVQPGTPPVWRAILDRNEKLILQPHYRHLANDRGSKVAMAGWKIMAECARRIGVIASWNNIKVVFTVIPTKELSFHRYLLDRRIRLDPTYQKLVTDEQLNIGELRDFLVRNQCGVYVDLVPALQELVRTRKNVYPRHSDGHPLAAGYREIASVLLPAVQALMPPRPADGLYYVQEENQKPAYFVVQNGEVWSIEKTESIKKFGFAASQAARIDRARLDRLGWKGSRE